MSPTATRPCSSAPSPGSRSSMRSRTRTASTKSFFRGLLVTHQQRRRPAVLVRSRHGRRPSTCAASATLIEFADQHYRYIVLDVPRSDAAVLDALELATRIVVVGNQELATVRSASRMARHPASALRQGKDLRRRQPRRTAWRKSARRMSNARSARRCGTRFPSDYRRALQALNKGTAGDGREPQRALQLVRELRALARGVEKVQADSSGSASAGSPNAEPVRSPSHDESFRRATLSSTRRHPESRATRRSRAQIHQELLGRLNLERLGEGQA